MRHDQLRICIRPFVAGWWSLALVGAGLLCNGCSTTSSRSSSYSAGVEIRSVDDFYAPLSPYGEWVVVGSYGRCWRPHRVDHYWRPYSDGSWVHCDAGWYWESAEPWGWATYHYGRWDYDSGFGWYWVPQTRWAPAWVAWRSGGGYVGWAPLRPSPRFEATMEIRDADAPERDFVFVPERRFVERVRPRTVIVNNPTIVRQTVNITKINVRNTTVVNEGPRVDVVERAAGTRVRTAPAAQLRREKEARVMQENPALIRSRDTARVGRENSAARRATSNPPRPESPERERAPRESQTTPPAAGGETSKVAPSPRPPDTMPTTTVPRTNPSRSKPKADDLRSRQSRPPQNPKSSPAEKEEATAARPASPPAATNVRPHPSENRGKSHHNRGNNKRKDADIDEEREKKNGE